MFTTGGQVQIVQALPHVAPKRGQGGFQRVWGGAQRGPLRWHRSRQCLIRRRQQCLDQDKVERKAGQQQDSDRQTLSMAAGSGGVVRPGWIVGREDWRDLPARLGGRRGCSTPWTSRL